MRQPVIHVSSVVFVVTVAVVPGRAPLQAYSLADEIPS